MSTGNYAYQVALKTLKERCDYLQNKLESVEEENCQLKLQISQDVVKKSSRSILDVDQLRLQITLLMEQKAKLNHQVELVTTENQNLWARLSKFTSSIDNHETKLLKDEPKKCLDGSVPYSGSHTDLEISKVPISPENSRESLEEISLKLNALILDKRGIPAEYPNTIDLYVYKNPLQMETFAFSSSDNNAPMLNSFRNHIMKLKQFKQILQNNKNDMTSAITLLKNFQKNSLCRDCGKIFSINCDEKSHNVTKVSSVEDQGNDLPTLQVHEVGMEGNEEMSDILDKKCPLCGETFSGSFQDFYMHVSDHFSDEEHDVTTTFEVVP